MKEKKLFGKNIAWSTRGASLAMNVVLLGYLTYYCTDVLGMSAGLVGGVLLLSKIFDGITDIIVGFIIDRTETRWGKARPYQAFILPCWLLTIFLFFVPDIGVIGQCIYIFCLYTLVNSVCATCLNGSDAVALYRCFGTEQQRVSASSTNGIITMTGCIIFSIALPQLIVYMGTDKIRWVFVVAIIGAVLGILGMGRFVFCKEVITEEEKEAEKRMEKVSVGESLKALFANKYAIMLTVLILLYNLCTNIGTAVNTYYFKYIIGDVGLASVIGAASIVTPIALIFYPAIIKKFGLEKILKVGLAVSVLGYVIRIIGGTNMITLMIGTILPLIGSICCGVMVNIYIVDCMTYGQLKTGKKIDGLVSSVTAFGNKVGMALASGIVGIIMGAAGYDGTLAVQSDTAILAINGCFNYLPLLITIVMFVISLFYHVERDILKLREAKEERKFK